MFHFSCQGRGDLLLESVGMFFDETVVDPYPLVTPVVFMDVNVTHQQDCNCKNGFVSA